MADLKNLELRGRVWWVHRRTPDSLRGVIGKHTLRRSLGTRDLAEAQRLRPLALADFARQLEEARKAAFGNSDPIAARAAAWQTFVSDAVDPSGQRISAPDRAALLALEHHTVALAHGTSAAKAFTTQIAAGRHRPLDAFLADFQAESRVKEKTKADQRMALRRLMAWKPELRLETVSREVAGTYATKGLTHTTSAETKNKHISCLRAYWSWMVKRGKLQDNPWKGQSFARDKAEDGTTDVPKERPFTDTEIKALLAGNAEPRLRDSMLILALSGMRREELCMLRVRDCDANAFYIRAAKTRAGIRRVPIHSDLVKLVAQRTAGKPLDAFVIHELGPEPAKGSLRGRGAPLTQQFERYRQSVGVHDKPDGNRRSLVNLHSFRRFFITKAERAGQPPWIIESVVGHKRTGMTLGVYSAGSSDEQLRACVEAVRLPA